MKPRLAQLRSSRIQQSRNVKALLVVGTACAGLLWLVGHVHLVSHQQAHLEATSSTKKTISSLDQPEPLHYKLWWHAPFVSQSGK
jgi:hypothetical protein